MLKKDNYPQSLIFDLIKRSVYPDLSELRRKNNKIYRVIKKIEYSLTLNNRLLLYFKEER